jgi:hypothetical protein
MLSGKQRLEGIMARRESFTAPLTCTECGTTGLADISENENPVFSRGKLERSVSNIEGDFKAGLGDDPSIYCSRCGEKVFP